MFFLRFPLSRSTNPEFRSLIFRFKFLPFRPAYDAGSDRGALNEANALDDILVNFVERMELAKITIECEPEVNASFEIAEKTMKAMALLERTTVRIPVPLHPTTITDLSASGR